MGCHIVRLLKVTAKETMKKGIIILGLCGLLGILPGCWRAVDWAKSNFYQGKCLEYTIQPVDAFIKSVRVYDLLSIRATFDAVWLSDEIRTAYVDLSTLRYGKSDEQRDALLRSQLEDNNRFISFFVLSSYEVPLVGEQVEWGLFLHINGHNITPIELKEVDLVPEYRAFFGKKFNQFKVAYLVKFNACDNVGRSLIASGVNNVALYFRSMNKEVVLEWQPVLLPARRPVRRSFSEVGSLGEGWVALAK